MKTKIEIDMTSAQAQQFMEYVRTLPFATVRDGWEEALAEGAITSDEFFERSRQMINKEYQRRNA